MINSPNQPGAFLAACRDLGETLNAAWMAKGFDYDAFPELAADHLRRYALHKLFNQAEVLNHLLCPQEMHPQWGDANFGVPPITVYFKDKFIVDVLFWKNAETSIHNHMFSGAFTVLSGESLDAVYRFAVEERPHELLSTGELSLKEHEHVKVGTVRSILSGERFIHQVWHIGQPTVSLVVRTTADPPITEQNQYFPRHVALVEFRKDPPIRPMFLREPRLIRAMKALGLFARKSAPLDTFVKEMLAGADAFQAFHLLRRYFEMEWDVQRLFDVSRDFAAKNGDWARKIVQSLAELALLTPNTGHLADRKQRMLIAMLCSSPDVERLHALIRQVYPGESNPQMWIMDQMNSLDENKLRMANVAPQVFDVLKRKPASAPVRASA